MIRRLLSTQTVTKAKILVAIPVLLGPVRPTLGMDTKSLETSCRQLASSFWADGYGVIPGFLSDEEVESLRAESCRLIREQSAKDTEEKYIFANEENAKNDYFVTSGDKVRYFFEQKAYDPDSRQLLLPVEQSFAKIGHALHYLNPVFRQLTTAHKVQQVFRAIKFRQPTVAQSMLIFKNPKVGGQYTPHQDASFLHTDPLHLAGVWLALDDATPENGCLEFIPGSHGWPLARRFVRVPEERMKAGEKNLLEWTAPAMEYDETKFVKVPVKRGSLVLIHGLVVHRSANNNSDKARWIYTFHAYDKAKAEYSKDNWLQVQEQDTFLSIYSDDVDKTENK